MNDKEQKYIEVVKKLLQKDGYKIYTVISNSMKPLIKKGDTIVCVNANFNDLKKYQIIAFQNNTSGDSKVPTVHRIIEKLNIYGDLFYKTKGDNSLYADKEYVKKEHFIGVADKIMKTNKTINLNAKVGTLLSMSAYFLFYIKNLFKLLLKNIKKTVIIVFKKENKVIYNDDLLVLRQSLLTKTTDWRKTVKNGIELIAPFISKDKKICDFSFGGGYCEESFVFIRKAIEVEYKNLYDADKNYFDVIICSRVINIVETKQKREEIYNVLKSFIKEDGVILLSYINEKNNFFIKLKRKIYKLISKKYDGPLSDDIVYEDKYFVMKNLPYKVFYNELNNNGFKIKKYKKSDNVISLLLSKKN